jgi:hypothetical protein
LTYKSNVAELEEDMFYVRASSNPTSFSKNLKSMETYIQKTHKMPDDIVKAIQQMKRPTLAFHPKPTKATSLDAKVDLIMMNTKWPNSPRRKNTRQFYTRKRSTRRTSPTRGL